MFKRISELQGIPALIFLLVTGTIGAIPLLWITGTFDTPPALPTVAAFPTDTPQPTATLSPDDTLYKIVDDAIMFPVLQAETNPIVPSVLIRFEMLDNNLSATLYQLERVFCPVRDSGLFDGYTYLIRARGQFVDQFGNEVDQDGLTVRLQPDVIEQVNCENISSVNWQSIADLYEVHRLIDG